MNFPLSEIEKKYIEKIEKEFGNQNIANFSREDIQKMRDIFDLFVDRGVLRDLNIDNDNLYVCIGSFNIFNLWIKDQEEKAKKMSRREWKKTVIGAVIGTLIGLIPTIVSMIGG